MAKRKKGFLVGKFAPFHNGHEYFIQKSWEKCDDLFIILSHDQRFFESIPKEIQEYFNVDRRLWILDDFIQDLPKSNGVIHLGMVDESYIPKYPNGWPEFINLCLNMMEEEKNYIPNMVFSSEPDYDPYYKKYLPNCEHILIEPDRSTYPISGTEIRKEMLEIQKRIDKLDKQLPVETMKDFYTSTDRGWYPV